MVKAQCTCSQRRKVQGRMLEDRESELNQSSDADKPVAELSQAQPNQAVSSSLDFTQSKCHTRPSSVQALPGNWHKSTEWFNHGTSALRERERSHVEFQTSFVSLLNVNQDGTDVLLREIAAWSHGAGFRRKWEGFPPSLSLLL